MDEIFVSITNDDNLKLYNINILMESSRIFCNKIWIQVNIIIYGNKILVKTRLGNKISNNTIIIDHNNNEISIVFKKPNK